jgi:hypothetical protein
MKRLLLVAALGAAGLFASTTTAQAQRTDTTYVKPQLPTGPPMAPPPAPALPTRPAPQAQPQQPAQQPPRPSGGIDDDGRSAQPLPGSAPAPAPTSPARPGGGIDDDGRAAQPLPKNGTVPGATVQAEYKPSKYFLYSNFNLGLSSNEFNGTEFTAGVSPAIGYRITNKLAAGPGVVYTYGSATFDSRYSVIGFPKSVKMNSVGLKGFAQFIVYKSIFLHAEYEVTKAQAYTVEQVSSQQYQVRKIEATSKALLGGAGYRQQLSDKFAIDASLLYNFNYTENYYGPYLLRFSIMYDLGR